MLSKRWNALSKMKWDYMFTEYNRRVFKAYTISSYILDSNARVILFTSYFVGNILVFFIK